MPNRLKHPSALRAAAHLVACAGLLISHGCSPAPADLSIENVTIVDGGAASTFVGTVLIRGDRIERVLRKGERAAARLKIDGTGKFLIPGLWDSHVHLAALDPVPRAVESFVSHGVTGVRDMGGRLAQLEELRSSIKSGQRIGPRVLAAGATVNGAAPADFHVVAETPEDIRATLDQLLRWGADFIKIHNQLSPTAFHALAQEARLRGLRFAGHVPHGVGLIAAARAGMLTFEHAEAWLEAELYRSDDPAKGLIEGLERLSGESGDQLFQEVAAHGVGLTPTLSAYRAFIADQKDPTQRELGERLYAHLMGLAATAHRAGVSLLAGTDSRTDPGVGLHEELALLVEAGLSPAEALETATRHPASVFGVDAGAIEEGKEASLVILDASPLDDIRNVGRVHAVILRGRHLGSAELRDLRTGSGA